MKIVKFDSDVRFKKNFVALTDKIKKTGIVDLEDADFDYLPTLRCNLRCKHCRQVDVRPNKEWTEIKDELNMEEIRKAWDKIDVKGKVVKINGGEPFVKKEMWDIFDYFKKRGAYNIVATNASIFANKKYIDKLRSYGLVEITCSFDGLEKAHDEIRGMPGLFKIMSNFVKEMAKDHKVLLECCIQKDNVNDLLGMLKLKEELGVYKIRFQLPVFTTKEEVEEASKVMGERLEYEAQISDSSNYDFTYEELMKNYKEMLKSEIEFDMHPKFFNLAPEDCVNRKIRSKFNVLCTYMFRMKIDPNGDIRFCPYIIKSFGNIKNDNLEEVWNSGEFKEFRKKIANNNLLPSCENCPHLRIYSKK